MTKNRSYLVSFRKKSTIYVSVDGVWADWGDYGGCSATCDAGGTKTRSRTCSNPAPAHNGQECAGDASDTTSCNTDIPCPGIAD